MKVWFKKNWKVVSLLVGLVVMRFGLSFLPAHSDVRIQAEWGKWMYMQDSVMGLYDNNVWGCIWPNHPPLISWIYFEVYKIHSLLMWWLSSLGNFIALNRLAPTKFMWLFNFTKWFGQARYETTDYLVGIIVLIKQVMVIADFAIAWIIYKLCKLNKVGWKKFVLAYLLLPFSWYLSAVWGQSNQLSFLFLIISFLLLFSKRSIWSPLLYAIALNLKPDSIFLIPLYLFVWFKRKQPWRNLILGGLLAGVFSLWTVTWFNRGDLLGLLILLPKRLQTSEGLITLNAFNFWSVLFPFPSVVVFEATKYLWIPAKTWGYIFWGLITLFSVKLVKPKKIETVFLTIFTVSFGSWLLMTGMHERYAFYGLVGLLLYSIYKKEYFKDFVILSVIFFLAMFYVFSVPQSLDGIKTIFNWGGQLAVRVLSIVNMLIYGRIFWREYKRR